MTVAIYCAFNISLKIGSKLVYILLFSLLCFYPALFKADLKKEEAANETIYKNMFLCAFCESYYAKCVIDKSTGNLG